MWLAFYDKGKEASEKGMQVPDMWQHSNILRYELRYLHRLNDRFKLDVRGSILYDKEFYYNISQNWYKEFKTIQKLKETSFMTDGIKTPKDAEKALFAALLYEKGQSIIDEFISELKAKNAFPDPKYYTRFKGNLNSMMKVGSNSEKSELLQELETEIFNIAKYAR
jgi:hypothetical protein